MAETCPKCNILVSLDPEDYELKINSHMRWHHATDEDISLSLNESIQNIIEAQLLFGQFNYIEANMKLAVVIEECMRVKKNIDMRM